MTATTTSPPRARTSDSRHPEAGFTLIEVLIAIVILVFGIMAVTNLMVVAASSNSLGNAASATTAEAGEVMERLKRIRFADLPNVTGAPVGNLAADAGTISNCNDITQAGGCVIPANFNASRAIPGVGTVKTRWRLAAGTVPADAQVIFITVRSEIDAPLLRQRSRAEFTTIRSCTATDIGCPAP